MAFVAEAVSQIAFSMPEEALVHIGPKR